MKYLTPDQWTTSISALSTGLALADQTFWVQNGNADWSIKSTTPGTVRFEVRAGDHWNGDADTRERSEISDMTKIANGVSTHVSYGIEVEQGAKNTAAWLVLGQFHQNDDTATAGNSPPFSINLVGEKMAISIGYTDAAGKNVTQMIFTDNQDIVRGQYYNMDVQVTFDPSGNGHLTVMRDGKVLADYSGKLGYTNQTSVYWKEGIYRGPAAETMAVDYKNLAITSSPVTALTQAASVQAGSTANQYDAAGDVIKKTVSYADGSKTVFDYKVTGQTYVSDEYRFDTTGKLLTLLRYHSDGTLDYKQQLNSDGSTSNARYDAAGVMTQQATTYTDGSVATRGYTGGTLTTLNVVHADGSRDLDLYNVVGKTYTAGHVTYNKAGQTIYNITYNTDGSTWASWQDDGVKVSKTVLTKADGSSTTDTYQITGKSYVTEHKVLDTTGAIASLVRYHADGTKDYSQVVGADKTVTTIEYNAAGLISKQTVAKADGSRVVDVSNVTGQSYTSQHIVYNAAGVQTALTQTRADGSKDYVMVLNTDGSGTATKYDTAGKVSAQTLTKANGSSVATSYTATGAVTQTVEKAADGSTLLKQYAGTAISYQLATAADGAKVVDTFGITGKTYVTQHAVYDAGGKQTGLVQYHADGSKDYALQIGADGSSTTSKYDATGHLTVAAVAKVDGSSTMTWYDAKGVVTQNLDTAGDGGTALKQYVAGLLVKETDTHADGSKEVDAFGITGTTYTSQHAAYDVKGVLTSLARYHADGTKDYSQVLKSDGSTTSDQYDASGKLATETVTQKDGSSSVSSFGPTGALAQTTLKHADGTSDIYQYGIEGKSYTSSHLMYDASKNLQLGETFNKDGTHTANVYAASITVHSTDAVDIFNAYGNDTFVFTKSSGNDVINNFHAGAASNHDTIVLDKSVVADFDHLAMHQSGSSVVIDLGDHDSVTLKGVSMAALTHHDFLFV